MPDTWGHMIDTWTIVNTWLIHDVNMLDTWWIHGVNMLDIHVWLDHDQRPPCTNPVPIMWRAHDGDRVGTWGSLINMGHF